MAGQFLPFDPASYVPLAHALQVGMEQFHPLAPKLANNDIVTPAFNLRNFIRPKIGPTRNLGYSSDHHKIIQSNQVTQAISAQYINLKKGKSFSHE
ncbi:hypothetical protein LOK49_LG13G00377 [Camellia lanceoleosa]|uniref:Uncharacterized protein n=1 Tax=Camellia lanceoleosa TaxID=1840588 RepID=A0ACC0FP37_9ERIC|nr:hypothetical protein LOK49_LG13G00377 [Camellia lanceoleosa]